MALIYVGVQASDSETPDARAGTGNPPASTPVKASDDAQLRKLTEYNPKLRLQEATLLIADENGSAWVMPSDGGQLCLVRSVQSAGKPAGANFACKDAQQADSQGIILGLPGQYYGYAPHGATVSAEVDGTTRVVEKTSSSGFRLPARAKSVSVGGGPAMELVQRAPSRPDR